MPWADAFTHDSEQLRGLRETARRIAAMAVDLGQLDGHPLTAIGKTEWSPSWSDEWKTASKLLNEAVQTLHDKSLAVGSLISYPSNGLGLLAYAALDQLADLLLAAPRIPEGLARQAHDSSARALVQSLAKHGKLRTEHWAKVGTGWTPELAKLHAADWKAQWSQAKLAWKPKSWFQKRAVAGRLAAFRTNSQRPKDLDIEPMLAALGDVNAQDQILQTMHVQAQTLLQGAYDGIETDWSALEEYQRWAQKFAQAVAQVAGTDLQIGTALRLALQTLVSDNRVHLAPSGTVGQALLAYRDAWREFSQKMDALNALAQLVEPLSGPANANGALARIQGILTGWNLAKVQLKPWCQWRNIRSQAIAQGLQALIASVESGKVALPDVERHFEFSYRFWWVKKIIDKDPVLCNFSSSDHERKIREFRQADEQF
ncbi:MAG: DNA helicase, partial [Rhodoferax sp.]|nr:DNA helicase [Rhodoferax sp.]